MAEKIEEIEISGMEWSQSNTSKRKKQLQNRLSRMAEQLNGISQMLKRTATAETS